MSIMRLKKRMAKYTKWVVFVFVVIFVVGSVVLGSVVMRGIKPIPFNP